jgi:hypothetical protein
MTATPSPDNLYVGKGEIFLDRFDADGNPTGELHLGNCRSLSIVFNDEVIESFNHMDAAAGLYKRTIKSRIPVLSIVGEEFTPEIMAIIQRGDLATLSQVGSTVTGQVITASATLGRWYKALHRGLSAVSVTQGDYTLVSGEDYDLDATSGRIYLKPESELIVEGDPIEIDYTYASMTKRVVRAGVSNSITGSIRFKGDPSEGPVREIEVWKADLTPEGEIGLITDEYGTWSLNASVLSDKVNHPNEPYYREIWLEE